VKSFVAAIAPAPSEKAEAIKQDPADSPFMVWKTRLKTNDFDEILVAVNNLAEISYRQRPKPSCLVRCWAKNAFVRLHSASFFKRILEVYVAVKVTVENHFSSPEKQAVRKRISEWHGCVGQHHFIDAQNCVRIPQMLDGDIMCKSNANYFVRRRRCPFAAALLLSLALSVPGVTQPIVVIPRVDRADAAAVKDLLSVWARNRYKAHRIEGIYIGIVRSPRAVRIVVDPRLEERGLFRQADKDYLHGRLAADLKVAKKRGTYDPVLISAVTLVLESLDQNVQGRLAPPGAIAVPKNVPAWVFTGFRVFAIDNGAVIPFPRYQ